MTGAHRVEGVVGESLTEYLNERLNRGDFAGLRWSGRMPDDDPDAELLVVAADGIEYTLEVEVHAIPAT